ncbi:NADAR family protein [Flammeovirgaceae bacterium SG7u.111]|nr:NADAR family protein [Flammeovirgaceae bacterium SG7u.132]WPO34219.1 NADAR family protein [Flammeovirgaceae bacterium SG7u.111]
MKYDKDWMKEKYSNDGGVEYLFFWGHQPRKDGQIGMSCLSQWYEREFEYDGIKYLTAEHWMMAEKAKLFRDKTILEKILNCNSPKEAKSLGRKVKNFEGKNWIENRERIVKNGNYLKFKQNKELWKYLDGTGDKVLVEASPYDKIWGIGMKNGDKGIENPINWRGLNLLGYALMEVRDKLRNE